ncbi:MAG: hypothetical protein KDI88_13165 [Gammaproteobacteria bacterium]|nr:hypothetical protein [Gammaproteobacteria bacterium]
MLTVASVAVSAQAQAYGNQWRPAAGGALPAHARPYQQMTNLPSFRPHGNAVRVGRAGPDLRRGERYLASSWRQRQQPAYRPSAPIGSHRPASMLASSRPMPAPLPPPGAMYRPQPSMADTFWSWQQMPTMARQFGMPGFVQSWVPQPYQPAAVGYQASVPPPAYGYPEPGRMQPRPHWPETAQYRGVPGTHGYDRRWRQSEPALSAVRSYQGPSAAQRVATWRTDRSTTFAAAAPRSNRMLGGVAAATPRWRTGATAWAGPQSTASRFRPASHGRSVNRASVDAPRVASEPASQTAGLPGWATTYTDDPWNSCGWCSGS